MVSVLILTGLILSSCGESVDAGREVYRRKNCVYNGEGGYYCHVNVGRTGYCYELVGPHAIGVSCEVYYEASKGIVR